jgi:hypothetical protein
MEEVLVKKPGYLSKGPRSDLSATKLLKKYTSKNKESIKITSINKNRT